MSLPKIDLNFNNAAKMFKIIKSRNVAIPLSSFVNLVLNFTTITPQREVL